MKGTATIQSARRVRVALDAKEMEYLEGENILIATGAKAKKVDLPGMDLPGVMTSEELLTSDASQYESLLILGGGVIGIELATVFNALGTKVTIVEIADRLLPNMDLEFSETLEEILRNRGIRICKESILEKIERKLKNGKDGLSCHFVYQGRNTGREGRCRSGVGRGEVRIRSICLIRMYRFACQEERLLLMISI